MKSRDFAYIVACDKNARQVISALWLASEKANWIVLGDYDMRGLIPEDEVESGIEVKTIDICKPEHAKPFVKADPLTALCMPCNVLVRSEAEKTIIAALRPGVMMPRLFPEECSSVSRLLNEIDEELKAIVDQAAK